MKFNYVFTSKISGTKILIKTLVDDTIIDGELRRIVKDKNGEIPDWAKPTKYNEDFVRITIDGNVYNKSGSIIRTYKNNKASARLVFNSNNKQINVLLTQLIVSTFDIKDVALLASRGEYDTFIYKKVNGIGINLKNELSDEYDKQIYRIWYNMICREKYDSVPYKNCVVQGRFLVFDYFKLWYRQNIYAVKSGVKIQLDKDVNNIDIMHPFYSEDTTLLIPYYINDYFIHSKNKNTGYRYKNGKYEVFVTDFITKHGIYIGRFDSTELAREIWLNYKTKQLHEVVLPYFINDIPPEYKNHPMILKIIDAVKNYKFT